MWEVCYTEYGLGGEQWDVMVEDFTTEEEALAAADRFDQQSSECHFVREWVNK